MSDRNRRESNSSSRGAKARRDSDSVDSGYGGSSATASPQSPTKRHRLPGSRSSSPSPWRGSSRRGGGGARGAGQDTGEKVRRPDACGREEHGPDSDSDYDPKARYYLPVDDDTYKDISFQGGTWAPQADRDQPKKRKTRSSRHEDDNDRPSTPRRPTSSHRHRSTSSGESSDFHNNEIRSSRSRRDSSSTTTSSRTARRDGSSRHRRRPLSPIPCETTTTSRRSQSRRRRPRSPSRSRGGWESSSDSTSSSEDDRRNHHTTRAKSRGQGRGGGDRDAKKTHRTRSSSDTTSSPTQKRTRRRDASSEYEDAADLDDAWYQALKARLVKGVDMAQVRKVGLDAAAVAAIKVAVGTQVPWRQRIPKTVAVGAAAALTDFLVAKTSFQPKGGMVGTAFVRQFAEILLANLVINPASAKITSKLGGGGGGGAPAGGNKGRSGGGGGRPSYGGRRERR